VGAAGTPATTEPEREPSNAPRPGRRTGPAPRGHGTGGPPGVLVRHPPSWIRRWWAWHKEDKVVEVGGSSVGPVDQVVGVKPRPPFAPGEPAGPDPVAEDPSHGPGDGPALSADPTGRPSRSRTHSIFPSQARRRTASTASLAPAAVSASHGPPVRLLPHQGLGPCVDHHSGRGSVLGRGAGQGLQQSVGHAGPRRVVRLRVRGNPIDPPLQGRLHHRALLGGEHPLDPQHRALVVPSEPQEPPTMVLPGLFRPDLLMASGLQPEGRGAEAGGSTSPVGVCIGGGEPGQGLELVPGQLALLVGPGDLQEQAEGPGHPHPLAGRPARKPVPGRQPRGHGGGPRRPPPLPAVVLGHRPEHLCGGRGHHRRGPVHGPGQGIHAGTAESHGCKLRRGRDTNVGGVVTRTSRGAGPPAAASRHRL
jgi:hypothetical protein